MKRLLFVLALLPLFVISSCTSYTEEETSYDQKITKSLAATERQVTILNRLSNMTIADSEASSVIQDFIEALTDAQNNAIILENSYCPESRVAFMNDFVRINKMINNLSNAIANEFEKGRKSDRTAAIDGIRNEIERFRKNYSSYIENGSK